MAFLPGLPPVPSSSDSSWDSPTNNDTTNAMSLPNSRVEMSLGGISFYDFQAPETFNWGTEVLTIKHRYIDNQGNPITKNQLMGAFPLPMSFKAKLYYATAVNDALRLETLCKGQEGITFAFAQLSWMVTIKKIEFVVHHQYDFDFEVQLEPYVEQNGGPSYGPAVVPFEVSVFTQADSVQTGLNGMIAANIALPSSVTASTNDALTALDGAFPLQSQTADSLTQLQGFLATAQAACQTYLTPLLNLTDATSLSIIPPALQTIANLGLLGQNVAQLLGTGPSQQTLTQFTGNLFNVAATFFPDKDVAQVAQTIATANGLYDLFVTSPTDIVLPPMLF